MRLVGNHEQIEELLNFAILYFILFYLVLKFQQYRVCHSQYFVSTISLFNTTGEMIMSLQHLSDHPGLLIFSALDRSMIELEGLAVTWLHPLGIYPGSLGSSGRV